MLWPQKSAKNKKKRSHIVIVHDLMHGNREVWSQWSYYHRFEFNTNIYIGSEFDLNRMTFAPGSNALAKVKKSSKIKNWRRENNFKIGRNT